MNSLFEEIAAPKRTVKELEKLVLHHRKAYYAGKPEISDREFDLLEQELEELAPNSKVLKSVGSRVQKNEVTLPMPMPSLNKVRPDRGADVWLDNNDGPYTVSDKLDGVSIELVYLPKKQVSAFTRGDGVRGGDISYLAPHLNIPQRLNSKMVVRGEIIMSKAKFERWSSTYKNGRNLAAGLTNRTDVHAAVPDLDVVVYSVLLPRGVPSVQLANLKALGFTVVPHKVYKTLSVTQLQQLFEKRRQSSKYEIDGLVIEQDISTPVPHDNPEHAVAFKDLLQVDSAEVTVNSVVWQESRYGKLTPVITFDPVRLEGVDVQRVTAHNAKEIFSGRRGVGAVIKVRRSGGVIPYLEAVIKPAKKIAAPDGKEGEAWGWNESKVDIFRVAQGTGSSDAQLRALTHFFSTLDVDGLRGGTLAKLVAAGYDSIDSILRLKPKDIVEVVGPTNAQKLGAEIRAKTATLYPADLAYAWGGFGRGVGSKKLWALWSTLGIAGMKKLAKRSQAAAIQELSPLVGPVAAKAVAPKLQEFLEFAASLPVKLVDYEEDDTPALSDKLEGVVVVMTGFRNDELTGIIRENSGKVVDSMTKDVTHVLAKDPSSGSGKIAAAQKKGLPVMTVDQFRKKFKV